MAKSSTLDNLVVKHSRQIDVYRSGPMETMSDRLNRLLTARQMKPKDLIKAKVLSRSGVYFLLDGTTTSEKVRAKTIEKLCKVLNTNKSWLLHGRGAMDDPEDAANDEDWSDVTGYAQAVGLGSGTEAQEYAETHRLKFRSDSLARKRLNPQHLHVMYGKGDSMLPAIKEGDAILFDTSDTRLQDGGVYVVEWRGEIYVKRAELIDDLVFMRSDNSSGDHSWRKPKRVDSAVDPINVIGRVKWLGSWVD